MHNMPLCHWSHSDAQLRQLRCSVPFFLFLVFVKVGDDRVSDGCCAPSTGRLLVETMAKLSKNKRSSKNSETKPSSAPFNNPFGALGALRDALPEGPPKTTPKPPCPDAPATSTGLESCGKLAVSEEKKGRAGKTVTRIRGLSKASNEEFASAIKSALGCGATWEGDDLVLLGGLADRARDYLERAGARRVVVSGAAGAKRPRAIPQKDCRPSDGTRLAELRIGMTVDIVLKADQSTGERTRGEIEEILTKSAHHPHGVKVRLRDGRVGRVKAVV